MKINAFAAGFTARLLLVLACGVVFVSASLTNLAGLPHLAGRADWPGLSVQAAWAESVRVREVIDGDTLRLTDGRSLRLAGLDTPELGHGKTRDQYYAREARDVLKTLVTGQSLTLRAVNQKDQDRHKRVLAEALLPDGRSVNELLLAQGAATAYWHKDLDARFWQRMLEAQRQALQGERGLWAHILRHKVGQAAYMGNRNSQRFFPTDCKEGHSINPRNRVPFDGLAAAYTAGYAPARVCEFWPLD